MARIARPSIVDVEASGFGSHSYPIEIGLALSSGERYCSLIIPTTNWTHWDAQAEELHHISRQTLRLYGKPIATVARELNTILGQQTIYTDGWVVDNVWIRELFYRAGIQPSFSVSALEMILSEPQMDNWHQTKDIVINDLKNLQRHRASADAVIIQETYYRTQQLDKKNNKPKQHYNINQK